MSSENHPPIKSPKTLRTPGDKLYLALGDAVSALESFKSDHPEISDEQRRVMQLEAGFDDFAYFSETHRTAYNARFTRLTGGVAWNLFASQYTHNVFEGNPIAPLPEKNLAPDLPLIYHSVPNLANYLSNPNGKRFYSQRLTGLDIISVGEYMKILRDRIPILGNEEARKSIVRKSDVKKATVMSMLFSTEFFIDAVKRARQAGA